MVSPKSFIGLLGGEYGLMREGGVLKRFYISSLLIVAIIITTGVSIFYAITLLFHSVLVETLLTVFFCLLFVCIYVFLLNTFAKEKSAGRTLFNASNLIRAGFIAFMGFQVAQPLMILLYINKLEHKIETYKQQLLLTHIKKIDALTYDEMERLQNSLTYYFDQKENFGTSIYDEEIAKKNEAIKKIQHKATLFKTTAQQTIEGNSFFLFQVSKVNRDYPLSWLFTFLIVVLFLLPGYLIYSISSQNEYYLLKKAQERSLVLNSYSYFLMWHKILFNSKIEVFSRYEDPPFNKIRKQPLVKATNSAFLKKYLGIG
jgi:hypothetical protein